jgi:hypothetical protein
MERMARMALMAPPALTVRMAPMVLLDPKARLAPLDPKAPEAVSSIS